MVFQFLPTKIWLKACLKIMPGLSCFGSDQAAVLIGQLNRSQQDRGS